MLFLFTGEQQLCSLFIQLILKSVSLQNYITGYQFIYIFFPVLHESNHILGNFFLFFSTVLTFLFLSYSTDQDLQSGIFFISECSGRLLTFFQLVSYLLKNLNRYLFQAKLFSQYDTQNLNRYLFQAKLFSASMILAKESEQIPFFRLKKLPTLSVRTTLG